MSDQRETIAVRTPGAAYQDCLDLVNKNYEHMRTSPFWNSDNRPKGEAVAELIARIITDIQIHADRAARLEKQDADRWRPVPGEKI